MGRGNASSIQLGRTAKTCVTQKDGVPPARANAARLPTVA
jgi:hypothetical protein